MATSPTIPTSRQSGGTPTGKKLGSAAFTVVINTNGAISSPGLKPATNGSRVQALPEPGFERGYQPMRFWDRSLLPSTDQVHLHRWSAVRLRDQSVPAVWHRRLRTISAAHPRAWVSGARKCVESVTARHSGWYLGGGVEMMATMNFIVGVEYKHFEFGPANNQPTDIPIDTQRVKTTADAVFLRLTIKKYILPSPDPMNRLRVRRASRIRRPYEVARAAMERIAVSA